MSKLLFIDLGKAFCKLAGLEQPEKLLDGNAVKIEGIDFYIAYDEAKDPEFVLVYCDFGMPPQNRLLEAYKALLEANRVIYGSHAPSFMLTPNGNVALAYHFRLGEIAAEHLMTLCTALAAQAKDWAAHYFLEGRAASSAYAGSRHGAAIR